MKRKLLSLAVIGLLAAPAAAAGTPAAKKKLPARPAAEAAEPAADAEPAAPAPAKKNIPAKTRPAQPAKKKPAAKPAAEPEAAPAPGPAEPAAPALPQITAADYEIKIGDIVVETPVTGITTAQETFDIFSPFDGRIEEVRPDLFAFAAKKEVLARMVSTEMAALLDSTPEEGRKQTEKRWQDTYKFYDITTDEQGVVTNIYVQPKTRVYKGDRLFTIARKVIMIGRNTEPLYSKLSLGQTAEIANVRSPELAFNTRLINFIPLKESKFFNRLWLEVTDLRNGIKIGQQFTGSLLIGKSSGTRLVPRRQLVESGGRKYLLMEVETGLINDAEIEIIKPGSHYLGIRYPEEKKEQEDGKNAETR